jgi:hypothetical protein
MLARRILPPPPTTGQRRAGWEMAAGRVSGLPTDVSAVSAWLRLAASPTSASKYTSWVDVLGGASATPVANGPAVATSNNGLPIATFAAEVLQWALSTANNGATKLGFAFWMKLANTTGNKSIAAITSTSGGASASKFFGFASGSAIRCDDQTVDRHAQSGTLDTGWHLITMEVDCTQGTEAGKVIQTIDKTVQTVSFSSDTAWSATLGTPTGNMLLGALTTAAASPFIGSFGPNFYWLNRQLTAGERQILFDFEQPT